MVATKAKKTTEEIVENDTKKQEEITTPVEDSEITEVKEETESEENSKTEETTIEEAPVEQEVETVEETETESPIEEVIETEVKDVVEVKEEKPIKVAEEEFDWEKLESSDYNENEREDLEKEYLPTLSKVEDKKVLDGTVVRVTDREVIIDINFKSDGVIGRTEFRYNPDLKPGDTVEVLVEKQEDKNGQLILSHRRARVLRAWEKVNTAEDTGEIVEGTIRSRTKGGMIVEVFGIEAFLPGSQIDVKPIRDYDEYVGKKMEFKVLKVNEAFRNVVVSHKALIEADIEEQKKEIMSKLEKGQVLEGVVKNTTSYGVFIDLGGVDGLIHITDLSWGRIAHPEEIVTLDEKINVVILDFDEGKKRIQLGLKQLSEHPWNSLDENLKVGDAIKGKVVVVADYGVFVEIQPGIEALLHVSEMSWSTHLRSANDFFKVGDEVDAQILTLDKEERKMSLGIKQMQEDPWSVITKKFPVDSKHNVKVINFTNFGIFVELDEGIDGLVHISDLSWTKKIKHPAEFTSVGEMLDVVVLEIDIENRRISLGHKQLEDNPWDTYETLFIEGNSYKGKIIEMFDKGALIALEHDVEAFAPKRHLEKEGGSSAGVGEELDFKVLEFSKENKKILVSHTDTLKQAEKKAKKSSAKKTKKAVEKIQETQQKSTLGDLDVLSSLKEDIDKKEKDSDSE
ncbi:MAG TPA: 30S ribosomal protein S1 [Flavobacteriales bacterium]|jgi:small subunit ribosomal protein S1|nr:30S ribosomal protein S1 [Flavobacteriales bacterium]HIK63029.1 30S ribosomal protein S1 [Flavobacteriales bacterium]